MSSLAPRRNPTLDRPARDLASALLWAGSATLWRLLHPAQRGRFVLAAPPPRKRVGWIASDGWRGQLLEVPHRPGSTGEPVLVLHPLALAPEVFDTGLAAHTAHAGFRVFLGGVRGAQGTHGRGRATLKGALERDVPAMLAAIRRHAGYPKVHLVGHGIGGRLARATARRLPDWVATVTEIGSPAWTGRPGLSRLPGRLPLRWAGPIAAALMRSAGPEVRTGLARGLQDIPLAALAIPPELELGPAKHSFHVVHGDDPLDGDGLKLNDTGLAALLEPHHWIQGWLGWLDARRERSWEPHAR